MGPAGVGKRRETGKQSDAPVYTLRTQFMLHPPYTRPRKEARAQLGRNHPASD